MLLNTVTKTQRDEQKKTEDFRTRIALQAKHDPGINLTRPRGYRPSQQPMLVLKPTCPPQRAAVSSSPPLQPQPPDPAPKRKPPVEHLSSTEEMRAVFETVLQTIAALLPCEPGDIRVKKLGPAFQKLRIARCMAVYIGQVCVAERIYGRVIGPALGGMTKPRLSIAKQQFAKIIVAHPPWKETLDAVLAELKSKDIVLKDQP